MQINDLYLLVGEITVKSYLGQVALQSQIQQLSSQLADSRDEASRLSAELAQFIRRPKK